MHYGFSTVEATNLALNKNAIQSNTWGNGLATRATDGQTTIILDHQVSVAGDSYHSW